MDLRLEAIINSVDDAIISVDEEQRVVFLNEPAARLFRCERSHAAGQPLAQFPELTDAWRQLNLDGAPLSEAVPRAVRRIQRRRTDADPTPLEAMLSGAVVNGKKIVTAVIRDIFLQQQMEAAVYQARKHQAIGALASGIAHDFNNILTAVISQIDLALHGPDCPVSLRDHLNYAQASARRGAELVHKLQQFSRQTKPKFGPLNLTEVIEQVVFVLRRSIDPRVTIKYVPPAARPWLVRADAGQIMHALVNLGLNARDAMPDGGWLHIQLANLSLAPADARAPRQAGDFVQLTVADTGRGMSPEAMARLFEPYFTTKDVSKGPGLGLSITFSVVAEHGGWMEVESRLGHGTQFHVFLPRTREPAVAPAAPDALVADTRRMEGRERILIVDDEEPVRVVMRAVLAFRGYQIVEAGDGEEALGKYAAASPPFDLVLMDVHLPRLNGRDALQRMREHNPRIKAILLSGGLNDQEHEPPGTMEGARFLQKPFQNQELVRAVREALDAE